MKVLTVLCFVLTFYVLSINCKIYEIWNPKVLAEMFANKSKDLSNSVEEQTGIISEKIQSYVDEVTIQKEEIKKDLEELINNMSNQVNDNLSDYLSAAKSLHHNIASKVNYFSGIAECAPDIYLDTVQLARKYGYDAESHIVQTRDGYLLTLHRIPHAKGAPAGSSGKQAVFLQHGLLSSSADFIVSGPEKGLAFVLAEAGYDVWLGNFRGNTYSRAHIFLPTDSFDFWNFSWHEIAVYDLPAMIDYVNQIKNDNELLYVGHSMGTTSLFALLSTLPEYNHKIKAAFCLAPVAYMTSLKSPIRLLAPFINSIEWVTENLGLNEFLPQNMIMKWLAFGCGENHIDERICENVMFVVAGFDEKQFNKTLLPIVIGHSPAGASTKSIIHFAQEIKDDGKFQQFDYGSDKNKEIYGQKTPPEYAVSKITLPIAFFSGDNDWLANISDAKKFYNKLSNPIEMYEVPYGDFNHLDFLWAIDAPTLVYKKLLELMQPYKFSEISWSFNPFHNFNWDGKIKYS